MIASPQALSVGPGPGSGDPVSVQVERLSKSYGDRGNGYALSNVSLECPPGKWTVLLGPSGCGKTTMLRCIAGLVTPSSGKISIGGQQVFNSEHRVDVAVERRKLGMVFQSYALWPHLTVERNVAYPLHGMKLSKRDQTARAGEMLELVGLETLAGRYIHELSGGQQQRVALARALAARPKAVLFDEPLSNLDARLRERIRLELRATQEHSPFTGVYVTHDQVEAMTLGDHVVVMRDGVVEQAGSPETIYRRPRSRFVAEFMGINNLLPATVVESVGEDLIVDSALGRVRARSWGAGRPVGSSCTIAVRSSLATLQHANQAGADKRWRVLKVIFQGANSMIQLACGALRLDLESVEDNVGELTGDVAVTPRGDAVFPVVSE